MGTLKHSWRQNPSFGQSEHRSTSGAFPNAATLYEVPVGGGQEQPLPVDLGAYGDYSPDGKQLVFNRKAGSWSRKHYRGSSSADLWIADLGAKTYRQLLAEERYNRFWPMWGADNQIYFVADPLPNDKSVQPGAKSTLAISVHLEATRTIEEAREYRGGPAAREGRAARPSATLLGHARVASNRVPSCRACRMRRRRRRHGWRRRCRRRRGR